MLQLTAGFLSITPPPTGVNTEQPFRVHLRKTCGNILFFEQAHFRIFFFRQQGIWTAQNILKVHKIEIFFGFDFEICIISLLVM